MERIYRIDDYIYRDNFHIKGNYKMVSRFDVKFE